MKENDVTIYEENISWQKDNMESYIEMGLMESKGHLEVLLGLNTKENMKERMNQYAQSLAIEHYSYTVYITKARITPKDKIRYPGLYEVHAILEFYKSKQPV